MSACSESSFRIQDGRLLSVWQYDIFLQKMRGHSQKILASISAGIFYIWLFILWLYLPNLNTEAAGKYLEVGILEWIMQKICVRGKGDLLTCGKNFCVNKKQLQFVDLPQKCNISCHFEAIMYALSCRMIFLIEISTSSF